MNREIKFRVWNDINKIMLDHECIEFNNCLLEGMNGKDLMQYTGLNDKNGKEIYEGDIVKYSLGKLSIEYMYEVKWCKGIAGFALKEIGEENPSEDLDTAFCRKAEVIGNIYEPKHIEAVHNGWEVE